MNPHEHPDFTFEIPNSGGADPARFVFAGGASRVRLCGAPQAELLRAEFFGPPPDVTEIGRMVTVSYPSLWRSWVDGWVWSRPSARIDLRAGDAWHVLFRGGAANLDADLRAVDVRSFEITGGVSGLVLALPAPKGIVPLRIRGGAVNVCILRPARAAMRVRLAGGVSSLRLDRMELGAVGGDISWESDGAADATDRYELEVDGGACDLLVDDSLEGQGGDHPYRSPPPAPAPAPARAPFVIEPDGLVLEANRY
jgi:hypothetical protein